MIPNHSPWIQQLKRTRPVVSLDADTRADVAIVGGGIAGICSAYFALRDTDKSVVLLEADKIAHGATGHNAGQIASYFERSLSELVKEFGFDKALDGQRSVESAWILLDQIIAEAHLQTPVYRFTGYAGISTLEQILEELANSEYRLKGGLPRQTILVAEEWEERHDIPDKYKDMYAVAPHKDVLSLLEASNPGFIACISSQKGCLNSALFCEELVGYMLATYKGRFSLHENSPIKVVELEEHNAILRAGAHTVTADRVVLCTNGFENFTIENKAGSPIDTKFHHAIAGRIGYMSGYIEPVKNSPVAISYHLKNKVPTLDPAGESYFYLTRRPYEHEQHGPHNLVCTGGPEKVLPNGADYSRSETGSEEMRTMIDDFLKDNYDKYPSERTEYIFCWHGLMGYTPNRIRRVGPEPCNPVLLYNLGCNGVGILPSIFGGKRIAQFLSGENVPASIFGPEDSRCEV